MSRDLNTLNLFEALDLYGQALLALKEQRYGSLMQLLGMETDLFPEGTTLAELSEVAMVRLATVAKRAGVAWEEQL